MSSWIKTDIDFGLPYKNFIVRYRSPSMAILNQLLTAMSIEEYLEPCAECFKPILADPGVMTFVKDHPTCPGQMIEVCKECYQS